MLEVVVGPVVGEEDDVAAAVPVVSVGHRLDAGESDGDAALLELEGEFAPGARINASVEVEVGDGGLGEVSGEEVEGVMEGGADGDLFMALEDLEDELEGGGEFGGVGVGGAVLGREDRGRRSEVRGRGRE